MDCNCFHAKKIIVVLSGLFALNGCGTMDVQGILNKTLAAQKPIESVSPMTKTSTKSGEPMAEVTVKFRLDSGQTGFFSIDTIESINIDNYEYSKQKLLQNDLKIVLPVSKDKDSLIKVKLKGFDRPFSIPVVSETKNVSESLKILVYVNFDPTNRIIDSIEVGYPENNTDKIDLNKNVFNSIDGETYSQTSQGSVFSWSPKIPVANNAPEAGSPPPGISMPAIPGPKDLPKQPSTGTESRPYPIPPSPPGGMGW